MAPIRNAKSRQKHQDVGESSSANVARKHKSKGNSSSGVPGVQKIKAALRQTRRLLAKDNLAADKRVESERKLKSLEADLEKAERARKERTLAQRYHKIKFFERQKVKRKITQTVKLISETEDKKEKKKLEKTLQNLRVDLNYILHYPKLKKYISLFPPEVRHGEAETPTDPKTDAEREEVRTWIRERMEKGELSSTPEQELESKKLVTQSDEWDSKSKQREMVADTQDEDSVEDDFFGDDNDE
ncbi:hypothetical protein AX16_001315 [Volvariella volvacea WC 439]|nr:hypothetical protein AX16_001315 [Volvariella volvacea WC 439]